jgi:hypothetical protein
VSDLLFMDGIGDVVAEKRKREREATVAEKERQ